MANLKDLYGEELYANMQAQAQREGLSMIEFMQASAAHYLACVEAKDVNGISKLEVSTNYEPHAQSTMEMRARIADDILSLVSASNGGRYTKPSNIKETWKARMARVTSVPPNKIAWAINCLMAEHAFKDTTK